MDFEEWFESLDLDNWTNKKYMHDAFEAGQQSKQAEIDALEKKLKYEKSAYRNIKLQFLNKQDDLDELQAEIDALQKRINDALNEIESGITGKHHVKSIINTLKGELK